VDLPVHKLEGGSVGAQGAGESFGITISWDLREVGEHRFATRGERIVERALVLAWGPAAPDSEVVVPLDAGERGWCRRCFR
jgi:hypothetical protein